MKVSELKELLKAFNDDSTVLMSKDGEGNNFRHVSEVSPFEVFEVVEYENYNEVYKQDVPEDVDEEIVVMIWPNY